MGKNLGLFNGMECIYISNFCDTNLDSTLSRCLQSNTSALSVTISRNRLIKIQYYDYTSRWSVHFLPEPLRLITLLS